MKFPSNQLMACAILSSVFLPAVTSCKKSNQNNSGNGGMTATINDTSWSANYPVTGTFTVTAGQFAIAGVQIKSGDTTGFLLSFNSPIEVDRALGSDSITLDVQFQNAKTGALYDGGALAGHSAVTITAYDSIGYKIAGMFSGVLYNINTGTDSLVVTGGTFSTTFIPE